ncbi:MAG: hypothetical protein ACK587_06570 [Cyanobacteriota bacterium]
MAGLAPGACRIIATHPPAALSTGPKAARLPQAMPGRRPGGVGHGGPADLPTWRRPALAPVQPPQPLASVADDLHRPWPNRAPPARLPSLHRSSSEPRVRASAGHRA